MTTITETYCDVCGRRDSWGCGHMGSQRRDARRHNATAAHREGRCWHYDHRACGPECQRARDMQPRSGWMPLVTHAEQATRARLEELHTEIRAERISYGELAELQGLAEHIEPGDVELLEWAGAPENEECGSCGAHIGPSAEFPWHLEDEDCRAIRQPVMRGERTC